ncbi:MAG: DUF2784 domain-containing protein [Candidatus Moranbacteria bacterium]|nr:DUF2784 domain-containing protein [Candidatus Moranbacteria bacterium]
MKFYRVLADAVEVFHWVWIVLMMAGIPLQFIYPPYAPIHLTIVTATIISQILWLGCPLVALENALRAKYDPRRTYTGSFVCHFLKKRFNITVSPLVIVIQLVLVAGISIVVLLTQSTTPQQS